MKSSAILKSILTVFVLLAALQTANAQNLPKLGVKGGLNLTTLTNSDGVDTKTGFIAGIFTRINIPATPISIQPELLYAQMGAEVSGGTWELDYIQIPVMAIFEFDLPVAPITPMVEFGPYLGVNMKADGRFNGQSVDFEDFVRDTDYGVMVGAGFDLSRFTLGARYTFGLADVFEDQLADGEKNGGLSILVSFSVN
ncbi:porin family protein [Balneola sp. MJW-20]|uniref:porin family protein n=1 Tax=Gracilimonas aurantiaca TaxID=3234185 RepID=UPI003467C81C